MKKRRKEKEERQVDVKRRGGKLKIDVKNKEDTNWFFILLLIFLCLMMIIFASYFFVMSGKIILDPCNLNGKCDSGEKASNCPIDCARVIISDFGFQDDEGWLEDRKENFPLVVYGSPATSIPFVNNPNSVADFDEYSYFKLSGSESYTPSKISVSAWVKPNTLTKEREIISKWSADSNNSYIFGMIPGASWLQQNKTHLFIKILVKATNGKSYELQRWKDISSIIDYNVFTQVGFVWDGINLNLYVNGEKMTGLKGCLGNSDLNKLYISENNSCVSKPSGFAIQSVQRNNANWIIGGIASQNYSWAGGIDEVKIWNYAIGNLDMKKIYTTEKSFFRDVVETLAYYVFNEDLSDSQGNQLELDSTKDFDEIEFRNELNCDNYYIDSRSGNSLIAYRQDAGEFDFTGNQAFAISFWTKLYGDEGKYSDIISKNENYRIGAKDNKLSFSVKKASGVWATITTTKAIPSNKWIFVSAVYDGTKIKLFVNGTKMKEASVGEELTSDGGNFVVMANSGDGFEDFEAKCVEENILVNKCKFNGAIDELIILKGLVEDADVKKVYESNEVNEDDVPYGYNKGKGYYFCEESGKNFKLNIKVCDEGDDCEGSFIKDETIYLDYQLSDDSEGVNLTNEDELANFIEDMNITAVISSPSGQNSTKELPSEVSFSSNGKYSVLITAEKPGYRTKTEITNFSINGGEIVTTNTEERTTEIETTELYPNECNNDDICGEGEDADNCPEDCSTTTPSSNSWMKISLIIFIILLIGVAGVMVYLQYKKGKERALEEVEEVEKKEKKK